jgi:hypothetical protein
LLAAVILGGVSVGVIAGGLQLADSQQVAERTATALVLSVTNCDRTDCSYEVSYLDAQGAMQTATIGADIGEANTDSTTRRRTRTSPGSQTPTTGATPATRLPGSG